jgi:hypothetical protein
VLGTHHVLCAKAEAAVGETVQRPKPREVGVGIEVRELGNAPLLGFVCGLAREGKVADPCGGDTGLQLVLDDAQEEGCFA